MIGAITAQWGRALFFSVEGAEPWTEADARAFAVRVQQITVEERTRPEPIVSTEPAPVATEDGAHDGE